MFKKLITLMIAVAFTTTTAFANTNGGLKAAFDEMNYSLNVEWDQNDKAFYDAQTEKFSATLKELQAEGLTNAELIEFVKAEVKDAKVAQDLETAFNMIQTQKMSASEAADYMTESMKSSYSVGASWSGDPAIFFLLAVVLILFLVPADSCYGSCN
jgi:hypothetical protein